VMLPSTLAFSPVLSFDTQYKTQADQDLSVSSGYQHKKHKVQLYDMLPKWWQPMKKTGFYRSTGQRRHAGQEDDLGLPEQLHRLPRRAIVEC
jgi:hypothetical protein